MQSGIEKTPSRIYYLQFTQFTCRQFKPEFNNGSQMKTIKCRNGLDFIKFIALPKVLCDMANISIVWQSLGNSPFDF